MKYVIVLGDGMADEPLQELGMEDSAVLCQDPRLWIRCPKNPGSEWCALCRKVWRRDRIRRTCPCWVTIRSYIIPADPRWKRFPSACP